MNYVCLGACSHSIAHENLIEHHVAKWFK